MLEIVTLAHAILNRQNELHFFLLSHSEIFDDNEEI